MNTLELYKEIITLLPCLDTYLKDNNIKEQYILGLECKIRDGTWSVIIENIPKYPQSIFMYSFSWLDANNIISDYSYKEVHWGKHYTIFKENYCRFKQLFSFKHIKII